LSSIRKFFTLGYVTFYGVLRKKVAVLQLMLEKEWFVPGGTSVRDWGKRQETRDKRQGTRDKRQETNDK
jgi:hypothetical protein